MLSGYVPLRKLKRMWILPDSRKKHETYAINIAGEVREATRSLKNKPLETKTMKLFEKIPNPRDIRRKLGLNQSDFWSKVGVTQSGGSRYESGRNMPKPVRELVRLVHVEHVDLTKIRKDDLVVAEMLKARNPDLYKSLKKAAKLK